MDEDAGRIQAEIERFTRNFRLTPKESEIFALLVNRVTTFKGIAQCTGSSPHTVKNQVRSIFSKTQTGSKCELLGLFLSLALGRPL